MQRGSEGVCVHRRADVGQLKSPVVAVRIVLRIATGRLLQTRVGINRRGILDSV